MSKPGPAGYYREKLSAERLKRCYEIAPLRVKQYLEAEVDHVLVKTHPRDRVLELGCGYGRVLPQISAKASLVCGIDSSRESLLLGREMLRDFHNCRLLCMDAVRLAFADRCFDLVVCIQNGISAFHVNPCELVEESLRVTRSGGTALFSSYSEDFWDHRLEWFELQSAEGLLGEIDHDRTGDGVIVCRDGFRATTLRPGRFEALTAGLDADLSITEVDRSSLFFEITRLD